MNEEENSKKNFANYVKELGINAPSPFAQKPVEERIEKIRNKNNYTKVLTESVNIPYLPTPRSKLTEEDYTNYSHMQIMDSSKYDEK